MGFVSFKSVLPPQRACTRWDFIHQKYCFHPKPNLQALPFYRMARSKSPTNQNILFMVLPVVLTTWKILQHFRSIMFLQYVQEVWSNSIVYSIYTNGCKYFIFNYQELAAVHVDIQWRQSVLQLWNYLVLHNPLHLSFHPWNVFI